MYNPNLFIKKYKIHKRTTTQAQLKIVVPQKLKIMGRKNNVIPHKLNSWNIFVLSYWPFPLSQPTV